MNRLTNKYEDGSGYEPIETHNVCNINLYDFNYYDYECCVDKLGKLEDLEEQLGCPLEVVFKALEEDVVLSNNKPYKCRFFYYTKEQKWTLICFEEKWTPICHEERESIVGVNLSDYQKTWWLKGKKTNG